MLILSIGLEFISVLILTTVLIWMLNPVAHRLGWLDRPAGRKNHCTPTPYHGGVAMYLGLFFVVMTLFNPHPPMRALILASGLMVVVGLLDDLFDVRWYLRVLAQIIAALILVYVGGVQIERIGPVFGLQPMSLGVLSVPFTVFATVGLINALNMSDGVDGLAGLLSLAALLMLAAAAHYAGNERLVHGLVMISAAVVAFLAFNLRRPGMEKARVFMGNAGSAFLGLVIAWAAFRLTQNPGHPVSPVLAPFLIAPPVIDCLVLLVRRIVNGRSPFSADRGHMHHMMLDAGFSVTTSVMLITGVSVLLGGLAALAMLLKVPHPLFVITFLGLTAAWYWLTARRTRAVRALHALHQGLGRIPVLGRILPALERTTSS